MAILSKGTTYATGDQVTAAGLNALVDSATFASGAVDNSSTALSGGAIIVKDAGITTAKIESLSNGQLLIGNGSGVTKATLTAGAGMTITNGSGSITLATTTSGATLARVTSDFSSSSSTYADVTDLSLNIVSGTTYTMEGCHYFSFPAYPDTSKGKWKLAGTGTVSHIKGGYIIQNSSNAAYMGKIDNYSDQITGPYALISGYVTYAYTFTCNGTGTIKWQFAQVSPSGFPSYIERGSYMKLYSY